MIFCGELDGQKGIRYCLQIAFMVEPKSRHLGTCILNDRQVVDSLVSLIRGKFVIVEVVIILGVILKLNRWIPGEILFYVLSGDSFIGLIR